ncbi:hypothetical protein HY504_01700 [Candidatus Wolfebacteria bacterium]|nr:hypothetical protein [Candidatus Wolfebacteria bacterium]
MSKLSIISLRAWGIAHYREIFLAILLFLISSLSFGLGYLTNREFSRAPIVIEKCSAPN